MTKEEPVAYINVEQRKLEWAKYTSWETPTVVNLPKIPLYTKPQLKQEQDEPMAEVVEGDDFSKQVIGIGNWRTLSNGTKLYTAPQTKKWVKLTENQIDKLEKEFIGFPVPNIYNFVKSIEAKLKEKNT